MRGCHPGTSGSALVLMARMACRSRDAKQDSLCTLPKLRHRRRRLPRVVSVFVFSVFFFLARPALPVCQQHGRLGPASHSRAAHGSAGLCRVVTRERLDLALVLV